MVIDKLGGARQYRDGREEMIRSHLLNTLERVLDLQPVCPAVRPRSECWLLVVNRVRGGTQISDHPRRVLSATLSDLLPIRIRVPSRGAAIADNPHWLH